MDIKLRKSGVTVKATKSEQAKLEQAMQMLSDLADHTTGTIHDLAGDGAAGIAGCLEAIRKSSEKLPLFDGNDTKAGG